MVGLLLLALITGNQSLRSVHEGEPRDVCVQGGGSKQNVNIGLFK